MDRIARKTGTKHPVPTTYYRVVLESIDPYKETKESFALKLSMQTHTPVTRINTVVNNMPYAIKSGLSMAQAKKFSSVLEELGGVVTIVDYVVSTGDSDPVLSAQQKPAGHTGDNALSIAGSQDLKGEDREPIVCSNCGWENSGEAEFCAFCYAGFGAKPNLKALAERVPENNPLIDEEKIVDEAEDIVVKKSLPLSGICVIGGLAVILIWVISRL